MPPVLPASQVFYTARRWRVLLYLTGPPLVLLCFSAPFWAKGSQDAGIGSTIFPAVAGLALGSLLLYALLETARWHFVIEPAGFRQVGVLKTRFLATDAVKGYRINKQYTVLVPHSPLDSTFKIGYTTERYAEINAWLATRYPNLDELDQEAATQDALANDELGRNPGEREEALASARRTATVLNVAGGAVAAWVLFYPHPYQLAVGAGLLLPLLGGMALWRHRGALWLNDETNNPYPSVMLAVLMPALGLMLRAMFDFNLVSYDAFWPVAGQIGVGTVFLMALGTRDLIFSPKTWFSATLAVVLAGALYGFGAGYAANAAFDESRGELFITQVVGKHSTSGKTTSYYLTVAAWGPFSGNSDVQVSGKYYQTMRPGSRVRIRLKPGRLGVPWYQVE